ITPSTCRQWTEGVETEDEGDVHGAFGIRLEQSGRGDYGITRVVSSAGQHEHAARGERCARCPEVGSDAVPQTAPGPLHRDPFAHLIAFEQRLCQHPGRFWI